MGVIYADNAATTRLSDTAFDAMKPYMLNEYGNASTLYKLGRSAHKAVENARGVFAKGINAYPTEIYFTSGGTESDNWAIKGTAHRLAASGKKHIVTDNIEHHAVLNAADALKAYGYKIDRVAPGKDGIVDPETLEDLLSSIEAAGDACCLVCVQGVNNELGTIQPIAQLARVAHEHGALFFCDAVQALGKVALDLEASDVDACAFSAHKIGAPKGIGALYLRRDTRITPLIYGGGQETGMRSGTSNVPGACAFAQAVESAIAEREEVWNHVSMLRSRLLDALGNGEYAHDITATLDADAPVVPHILSLRVRGLEGETLVLRCDNAGFAISSGSACSSSSLDPSHVLMAIGLSHDDALGGIRLSFGKGTSVEDIDRFAAALPEVLR